MKIIKRIKIKNNRNFSKKVCKRFTTGKRNLYPITYI